jgi:hypothetical protein
VTSTYTFSYYTTTYTVTSSGAVCPTPPFKREEHGLPAIEMEKRQRTKKPACLSKYKSASDISSACNCVEIAQSTTTVTTRSTSVKYKYTQITTDLTTTKTLIPAPTCSTVAANSSYDLSYYYGGCGFNRPVSSSNGCVSTGSAQFSDYPVMCDAIKWCAGVAADHFAYPESVIALYTSRDDFPRKEVSLTLISYTTFQLLFQPQGQWM